MRWLLVALLAASPTREKTLAKERAELEAVVKAAREETDHSGTSGLFTTLASPAMFDYVYADQGVTQWRANPTKKSITITPFGKAAGWHCE